MIPACYVAAYLGITKPDLRGSQQGGAAGLPLNTNAHLPSRVMGLLGSC